MTIIYMNNKFSNLEKKALANKFLKRECFIFFDCMVGGY